METNVNYTVVGAFVLIMSAAIIMGIIWLSSGFSLERYNTYKIYMQESVSGLNEDSTVEYNGVNVGSVRSIELNRQNPQLVEILLNIKSGTPITNGTVATLTTKGLTGVTYIGLKDKSTDLTPLVAKPGQPYPVIRTAPSIFLRIDIALTQFSKSFHEISESIQKLLDQENLKAIKGTLSNLQNFTRALAQNSKKITTILDNTSKATQRFEPLLRSGTNAMRAFETQTLPAAYQLISNLDDVSQNLSDLTAEIKQNPSVIIRGSQRIDLGPGERR